MVDKTTLEVATKNLFLVFYKYTDAFVLEFSDYASTQLYNLLIVVIHALFVDSLKYALLSIFVEECQQ